MWKRLRDVDGVVHEGRRLSRVVHGSRAERTELFRPRCDKTRQLTALTDAGLSCIACMVLRQGKGV
jgi:hypothetical protein